MADDLFADQPATAREMLMCAQRELEMRERVYPRWIALGKMSEGRAAREIALMRAIAQHFAERDVLGSKRK
jgi:hypothetical protein